MLMTKAGARFTRGGFAVAAALAVAACGSESTTEPEPAVVARYTLSEINGAGLPATVLDVVVHDEEDGDTHLQIIASQGSLELRVDGSYVQKVKLLYYTDGSLGAQRTYSDRGTYQRTGNDVMFVSGVLQGVTFHGAVQGEDIVAQQDLAGEGVAATYGYHKEAN